MALLATNRRDFLRGRPLAYAVRRFVDEAPSNRTGPATLLSETRSLVTVTRRAMACLFEVDLPAGTPNAVPAASAALDEIDRLEDQLTVYRDTSEVSRINLLAAYAPVPVEERLFELLRHAIELNDDTGGAFDIAAGALIKAWGFFRGPKRVPEPDELAQAIERTGSRHIAIDHDRRTIALGRPGVELNLGSIGKGYALDRAAELLRRDWNISHAIMHGGRSTILAVGPESPDEPGWLAGVVHPTRPDQYAATVRLRDMALGTSGATIQYFTHNGRRFGHILDPRSGRPADGHVCVSVVAPTAAEADALSTAFFIRGPEFAREYCNRRPEIGAIVVADRLDGMIDVEPIGRAREITAVARTNRT